MYQQAGSANHGCEALVRTIMQTINSCDKEAEFVLVSSKIEEDKAYALDAIPNLKLVQFCKPVRKGNLNWIKLQLGKLLRNHKMQMNAKFNLEWADEEATFIAMGGDNYCYNKGRSFYDIDNYIKGKKILWGCSIEPNDLDEELVNHLRLFSIITARETITYEALRNKGFENVYLVPDTAFVLPTIEREMVGEYIGINISPLIMNYSDNVSLIYANYSKLIEFILTNTNKKLMLIAHVVTDGNDDRIAFSKLLKLVEIPKDRLLIVEDCNCMQLKGYVSKCAFFIGARTHATIAAYSSNVPTLVVGYSVKSKGIARDIYGNYNDYVVSVKELKSENDLLDKFLALTNRKDELIIKQSAYTKKARVEIEETYKKVLGII